MKKQKGFKNYIKNEFSLFLGSFKKLDRRMIYTVLIDFVFVSLIVLSIMGWNSIMIKKMGSIDPTLLENPEGMSAEQAAQAAELVKGQFAGLVLWTIAIALSSFLLMVLFKGWIWNIVMKKRTTLNFFGKFLLLNLLWYILWLVPSIIIVSSLKETAAKVFFLIAFALCVFFTAILYVFFIKSNLVFDSVKNAFSIGFGRISVFIAPILFIALTVVIISIVTIPMKYIPLKVSAAISIVILFVYTAWIRFYFADVVEMVR